MNKTKLLTACLIGTGIVAAAAVIGASQMMRPGISSQSTISSYFTSYPTSSQEMAEKESISDSSAWEAAAPETPKYRISVYKEHVAVFLAGREIPYQILETRVDSLPEYDQALLREGVAARDEAELTQLLQDYES